MSESILPHPTATAPLDSAGPTPETETGSCPGVRMGTGRAWRGAGLVLMGFLVAFFLSFADELLDDSSSSGGGSLRQQVVAQALSICLTLLGIMVAWVGLSWTYSAAWSRRSRFREVLVGWRRPQQMWAGVATLGWVWGVILVPGLAVDYASRHGVPLPRTVYTWDPAPWGLDLARSLQAGIGEELLVVVIPLMYFWRVVPVERRRRWMSILLMLILIGARLSYHLYYGWQVSFLLVWMVAMPLIYWRYRQGWALIVAHTIYDLIAFGTFGPDRIETLLSEILTMVGLALAVVAGIILHRRHTPAPWQLDTVNAHEN